jgi:hypothetical protein
MPEELVCSPGRFARRRIDFRFSCKPARTGKNARYPLLTEFACRLFPGRQSVASCCCTSSLRTSSSTGATASCTRSFSTSISTACITSEHALLLRLSFSVAPAEHCHQILSKDRLLSTRACAQSEAAQKHVVLVIHLERAAKAWSRQGLCSGSWGDGCKSPFDALMLMAGYFGFCATLATKLPLERSCSQMVFML